MPRDELRVGNRWNTRLISPTPTRQSPSDRTARASSRASRGRRPPQAWKDRMTFASCCQPDRAEHSSSTRTCSGGAADRSASLLHTRKAPEPKMLGSRSHAAAPNARLRVGRSQAGPRARRRQEGTTIDLPDGVSREDAEAAGSPVAPWVRSNGTLDIPIDLRPSRVRPLPPRGPAEGEGGPRASRTGGARPLGDSRLGGGAREGRRSLAPRLAPFWPPKGVREGTRGHAAGLFVNVPRCPPTGQKTRL